MGRAGFTCVGRAEGEGHLTELRGVFPEGMGAVEGERGGRRRGHFKGRGISLLLLYTEKWTRVGKAAPPTRNG